MQVACGQHHTLALTAGGHLYGWGDNRRGQLGQGPPTQETPRQLMTCDSSAIVKAGWTHSALLTGNTSYCHIEMKVPEALPYLFS